MAEEFFKAEIETYLDCNDAKATDKQISLAVDILMASEDFWGNLDLCILDALREVKVKGL